MKWEHICSLDWLKARQNFLTASDIKELLPVTKTGRKRTITDADRLRVYAKKLLTLTQEDCISTGVMARGHLLEPYAIEEYNKMFPVNKLYHWDDVVIAQTIVSICGFSPDATDIKQPYLRLDEAPIIIEDYLQLKINKIGEVKSYNAEKHLALANLPKNELEERWQIAHAMISLPSINQGELILFNPKMENPKQRLFVKNYSRVDLNDELEILIEVIKDWNNFMANNSIPEFLSTDINEEDIIKDIEEKNRLNP